MAKSLQLCQTLNFHTNDVSTIDICNNILATGSNDKSIGVFHFQLELEKFEVAEGSPLLGHQYGVTKVRISPYLEYLVSSSRDGKIIIWNLKYMKILRVLQHEDFSWIRALSFSKMDTYIATAGENAVIKIWNYSDFSAIKCFIGNEGSSVTCVTFSLNNAYIISGDFEGRLTSWSADTPHLPALCVIIEAHDMGVFSCEISTVSECTEGQNLVASCGNDNDVKLWTLTENGQIVFLRKYSGHAGFVNDCKFINETLILSVGSDRKLHLWNQETGEAELISASKQKCLLCCAVSESCFAVGSTDHSVLIWKLHCQQNVSYPQLDKTNQNSPSSWTADEVFIWLEESFPQYSNIFRENNVDFEKLKIMTNMDLCEMGISDSIIQKEILMNISKLLSEKCHTVFEATDIPNDYLCPITHELMSDPVIAEDGFTYEKKAIERWFEMCEDADFRSPVTNEVLTSKILISNKILARIIAKFNLTH